MADLSELGVDALVSEIDCVETTDGNVIVFGCNVLVSGCDIDVFDCDVVVLNCDVVILDCDVVVLDWPVGVFVTELRPSRSVSKSLTIYLETGLQI